MRAAIISALLFGAVVATLADTKVKVVFFDDNNEKGDAASYEVNVATGSCTSCQGFGIRLRNSWESYALLAPTTSRGNYTLTVYDGGNCQNNNDKQTLTKLYGDFSGSLQDSVDSWKVCPPGVNP